MLSVSMLCFNVLAAVYKMVSSTYMLMGLHLTACGRLVNSTNISGPRMEPCGTPYLGVCQNEVTWSTRIHWHLPFWYVSRDCHIGGCVLMPKQL